MKKAVLAGLILLSSVATSRANDDAEKLIGDMLKTVEDLGTQLKKVTDKDSAEAALPKVKELTKQFSGLKGKSDKLKLDPDTESRLLKQYEKKLFDAGEKVGQELKRLRQVDPAREVVAEVEKFVALLGNTGKEKKK
jgi:TolA-binding protein